MITINYMNKYPITISENTFIKTPGIFNIDGTYWERDSVDYFYTLVDKEKKLNIVDIGAHCGLYTLYSKYLPNCRFFSFEPNITSYQVLQENCIINNINNVTLFNMGIGNEKTRMSIQIPSGEEKNQTGLTSLTMHPIRFSKYISQDINITTLDDEFYNKNIRVDLIKCDTEGWEPYILEGGINTIKAFKPDIFIEVNDTNLRQCNKTRDDLLNILETYNYKYISRVDDENFHFTYRN